MPTFSCVDYCKLVGICIGPKCGGLHIHQFLVMDPNAPISWALHWLLTGFKVQFKVLVWTIIIRFDLNCVYIKVYIYKSIYKILYFALQLFFIIPSNYSEVDTMKLKIRNAVGKIIRERKGVQIIIYFLAPKIIVDFYIPENAWLLEVP